MLRTILFASALWSFAQVSSLPAESPNETSHAESKASDIIEQAGISSGFFVHLGARNGQLTSALRQNDSTQVHGLVLDRGLLDAARAELRFVSKYGDVAVDHLPGDELPYVDNLVNLLVAESMGKVTEKEVLRVLTPEGVAMIKTKNGWNRIQKPRPDNIDEWSHYLHDASGNSVAHDDVVAPPRHLQWVGSPKWSRHHDRMASMSALVSSGGKMFYIMDEGSRISIQLPSKWKLIARDAFNGCILWKKDIKDWQSHLWPLKSGPTQLSRRLVSSDKELYVTLGFDAPLSALDTTTGQQLRTYSGSDGTEEVIHSGDLLFLIVRKGKAELADYTPLHPTVGDQARSRNFFWNEEPRVVMAYDAQSGEQLWAKQTKVSPLSLAAKDSQVYLHDGERLVSLDGHSGDVIWESEPVSRRESFTFNFGPRLVLYEDVVLYSGGDGKMLSLNAKSGKKLWDAKFPNSGYQSPQDLMVVDGLVWLAPTTGSKDSGVYTGRDPRTGEVKKEFAPDVDTYWFHHRCYIAKGTDNFLMPSRTGIEFVDPDKEHWDIHHWVRGGCLYGVMPCNGLTYAPPHNCACYPEAKLFGFNALAPLAPTRPVPSHVAEEGRLERGSSYGQPLAEAADSELSSQDWPTYRHDQGRSGTAGTPVEANVRPKWEVQLGGRLTSPVVANGKVYVAKIDEHTLYALDENGGNKLWTYTVGARIDSPPTVHRGRVVFGSADGWVYCLNERGELAWRYRVAPIDRRAMAYEQLESLWPVHGSVLIRNDTIYCVAGRSNFLDGGLRLIRLDLASGEKLSETIMDETNPETGNNLQEKLQVLQMPVGLPDILSCDGEHIFMKSQKFDLQGNRLEIGPNSGDFPKQAAKQRGADAHIFAPMGFLDDTWFHRAYWVHGQSFAGGHAGYYQAGRFAPSGRILVKGNGYVYGYGRKPQYLRWTTVLEHQLFAADPNPPEIPEDYLTKKGGGANGPSASFSRSPSLDPANKPLTVEAWVTATKPNGVIIARGGPAQGFALTLKGGSPQFLVRSDGTLNAVTAQQRIIGGWHHVAGVLAEDKQMNLYVDGQLAASGTASNLIASDPAQGMEIGLDAGSSVGNYPASSAITGVVDEVRLYFRAANREQIAARYEDGSEISADAVLAVSFDDGTARDQSRYRNNGTLRGGRLVDGKHGKAIQFTAKKSTAKGKRPGGNNKIKAGDSLVKPKWAQDVPVYVRGMVLAGNFLFIVGPPDTINEEETFQQLSENDPRVQQVLDAQNAALEGANGSSLLAINIHSGAVEHEVELESLPTWDGLAAAGGELFLTTLDGSILCFAK